MIGRGAYKGWYFDGMLSTRVASASRPDSESPADTRHRSSAALEKQKLDTSSTGGTSHLRTEPNRLC